MIKYCTVIHIYLLENHRLINFPYLGKTSLSLEVIKKTDNSLNGTAYIKIVENFKRTYTRQGSEISNLCHHTCNTLVIAIIDCCHLFLHLIHYRNLNPSETSVCIFSFDFFGTNRFKYE